MIKSVTYLTTNIMLKVLLLITLAITMSVCGCNCGGGGDSANQNNKDINKSVTLLWDAPTTNMDGSLLTDLAGFKIYYRIPSADEYSDPIIVPMESASCKMSRKIMQCTYIVNNLNPGTYYFALTAYNDNGAESHYSNERAKIIK